MLHVQFPTSPQLYFSSKMKALWFKLVALDLVSSPFDAACTNYIGNLIYWIDSLFTCCKFRPLCRYWSHTTRDSYVVHDTISILARLPLTFKIFTWKKTIFLSKTSQSKYNLIIIRECNHMFLYNNNIGIRINKSIYLELSTV